MASETPDQRKKRLLDQSMRKALKRANKTLEELERRQQSVLKYKRSRREAENQKREKKNESPTRATDETKEQRNK